MSDKAIIPTEIIEKRIFLIRGQKVMLDVNIAELYQVETKALKRAVKRNRDRFPNDFCFELTKEEVQHLRYYLGTSRWGGIGFRVKESAAQYKVEKSLK